MHLPIYHLQAKPIIHQRPYSSASTAWRLRLPPLCSANERSPVTSRIESQVVDYSTNTLQSDMPPTSGWKLAPSAKYRSKRRRYFDRRIVNFGVTQSMTYMSWRSSSHYVTCRRSAASRDKDGGSTRNPARYPFPVHLLPVFHNPNVAVWRHGCSV